MQDHNIIKLLDIKDTDLEILYVDTHGTEKIIAFEKKQTIHYCPRCSCRMYSKGIYRRHINHPVMQDGYSVTLVFHQRRWICQNPDCRETVTDKVSFLDKGKRNTNITDFLIVQAFKDPHLTAAQIARRFNVSDTYAIYTFDRYVSMHRRTLTEAICVDEVHLNLGRNCKYALVILDFATGEPLDLVISRRKEITEPYFASISAGERAYVKYIVSDMYGPFLDYSKVYFPNAISAVDSFHVIKFINSKLRLYLQALLRKLNEKDLELHEKQEQEFGYHFDMVHSREYKIIKNYQWLILSNNARIEYGKLRWDFRYHRYIYPSEIETDMFKIDPNLKALRDLKEKYITFNDSYVGDPKGARGALFKLIETYRASKYTLFHEIADSLEAHFEPIINSFILVKKYEKDGATMVRLSNGVMESLNRIPKDMKRNARGYRNFEHIRNRFLYATRKNAQILGCPKSWKEVRQPTNLKRGPYKKNGTPKKLK